MDEQVLAAMAKWPDVPHAYGWLSLDARGRWLLKGSWVTHQPLIRFIQRNYAHDDAGRWYFQNGPQRVYCTLESAPYILSCLADGVLMAHDGAPVTAIRRACVDPGGRLFVVCDKGPAALDDRALASVAEQIEVDPSGQCLWHFGSVTLPIAPVACGAAELGFDPDPRPALLEPEC